VKVSFLKVAQAELDDAFAYYDSLQSGLGFRFLSEVESAIARIIRFPFLYEEIGQYSRRCLVQKFPYGIIYKHFENEKEILIVAVYHLHRRPGHWTKRE